MQNLVDLYIFTHSKSSIQLLVYINNIVATAKKKDEIDWFYKKLFERFNTKPLKEIYKILSIRVTRDRKNRTIYID